MTLLEMSACYEASARKLIRILKTLRERERTCADEAERRRLHSRIIVIGETLTETRELAQLTAHYYDRGFWRNEKYTL